MRTRALELTAAASLLLGVGCGEGITDSSQHEATVAQVVITPASSHIRSGAGVRLAVSALDVLGRRLSPSVTGWVSSDPAVATVTPDGVVTALQPGSATITATSNGATGTCEVTVEARQLHGLRWTRQLPASSEALRAVWGSSDTNVLAVGGSCSGWGCEAVILHYDGSGWSRIRAPALDQRLTDIWGSSATDVFAVGDWGLIAHYDGRVWSRMPSPAAPGACFGRIWGSSGSDVYAVGAARCDPWGWDPPAEPLVLHYDGHDWRTVALTLPGERSLLPGLEGVWGSSASDVFAVGHDLILHYDGTTWSRMGWSSGMTALHQIWGTSAQDVFAVGGGGAILHYDGQRWSGMAMPWGCCGDLSGIWGTSPTNVFAVGPGTGLLHYDGTSWAAADLGPEVTDVWTFDGKAIAVGPRLTIMQGLR